MSNSRWAGIQSWEKLKELIVANPGVYVVDTGGRERRFKVVTADGEFITTVDGRSVRVAGVKVVFRKGRVPQWKS